MFRPGASGTFWVWFVVPLPLSLGNGSPQKVSVGASSSGILGYLGGGDFLALPGSSLIQTAQIKRWGLVLGDAGRGDRLACAGWRDQFLRPLGCPHTPVDTGDLQLHRPQHTCRQGDLNQLPLERL